VRPVTVRAMAVETRGGWIRPAVRIVGAALVLAYVARFFGSPGVIGEGEKAPGFRGTLDDGTPIDLDDGPGSPLVLSFWASWCGPCREEAPILNALHDQGVRVVGVSMDSLSAGQATAAGAQFENLPVTVQRLADLTCLSAQAAREQWPGLRRGDEVATGAKLFLARAVIAQSRFVQGHLHVIGEAHRAVGADARQHAFQQGLAVSLEVARGFGQDGAEFRERHGVQCL